MAEYINQTVYSATDQTLTIPAYRNTSDTVVNISAYAIRALLKSDSTSTTTIKTWTTASGAGITISDGANGIWTITIDDGDITSPTVNTMMFLDVMFYSDGNLASDPSDRRQYRFPLRIGDTT